MDKIREFIVNNKVLTTLAVLAVILVTIIIFTSNSNTNSSSNTLIEDSIVPSDYNLSNKTIDPRAGDYQVSYSNDGEVLITASDNVPQDPDTIRSILGIAPDITIIVGKNIGN